MTASSGAAEPAETAPVEPSTEEPSPPEEPTTSGWLAARLQSLEGDREALGIWVLSRVAVFVSAAMTGWYFFRFRTGTDGAQLLGPNGQPMPYVSPFLERWEQWDFFHYRALAEVLVLQPPNRGAARGVLPRLPVHAVGVARLRHAPVLGGLDRLGGGRCRGGGRVAPAR